ncbi:hypothetical protein Tsp_06163, partial [Trichinella spiralis]
AMPRAFPQHPLLISAIYVLQLPHYLTALSRTPLSVE